jgi:hypothetical protein
MPEVAELTRRQIVELIAVLTHCDQADERFFLQFNVHDKAFRYRVNGLDWSQDIPTMTMERS